MNVRRIVTEASNRTEPDALRDLQVTLNGLRSDLQDLKGGGGGGGKRQWYDIRGEVLAFLVVAVLTMAGGTFMMVRDMSKDIKAVRTEAAHNTAEINRIRDWRDRHVEAGR